MKPIPELIPRDGRTILNIDVANQIIDAINVIWDTQGLAGVTITKADSGWIISTAATVGANLYFGGGWIGSLTDVIDSINTGTDTINAVDKCNLSEGRWGLAAGSSTTNLYFGGGYIGTPTRTKTIDSLLFAADTTNAVDKCDLNIARAVLGGTSSSTRVYFAGGDESASLQYGKRVSYVSFANDTLAVLTTPLDRDIISVASGRSTTHGYFTGMSSPHVVTWIQRLNFATDATDEVGKMFVLRKGAAGVNSTVNQKTYFGGGVSANDVIEYDTIDSLDHTNDSANCIDKSNLVAARSRLAGAYESTKGYFVGGKVGATQTNMIDAITFATDTVNAVDKCDLSQARESLAGGQAS